LAENSMGAFPAGLTILVIFTVLLKCHVSGIFALKKTISRQKVFIKMSLDVHTRYQEQKDNNNKTNNEFVYDT
jgi:hypothetical protein